jgi:glutaredoxin
MIEFYRTEDCPRCQAIEQALDEMKWRYNVTVVRDAGELPEDVDADSLPVLVDEDGTFAGPDAIRDHLEQLEDFRERWYMFQSDTCYCLEDQVE